MYIREDINGAVIGGYESEASYHVEDFTGYPIEVSVNKASSTESVYVIYKRTDDLSKSATVRFSWHTCNGVMFGDYIDGNNTSIVRNEILYRLGFKQKKFVPFTKHYICKESVGKKRMKQYEMCDKTIEELVKLPIGTDLSEYVGKIAKDSNILIKSDKVLLVEDHHYGRYEYFD